MSQVTVNSNQEWLKVLGKGMITIPKGWRDELGIEEGTIVKAKKEGNKVIIEAHLASTVPYRVYSDTEINEFLKEDTLPQALSKKVKANIAAGSRV